jgi:flagellin-specific chaperone FliS
MNSAASTYQRQAVKNASPTELIGILYDLLIQSCHKEESEKGIEILSTLIRSLNFDYEMAGDLFGIYEYCQRQLRKENYAEVIELIDGIRETWNEAVVNQSKPQSGSFNIKG